MSMVWRRSFAGQMAHLALRPVAALLLCCTLSPSTWADDAPLEIAGAKTVSCKGVVDLISTIPNLVIIDNRTQADFKSGHIEGAIHILDTDMTEESLAKAVKTRATPLLFYCNGVKCGRAAKATSKAVEWGYSNVYYYAEGIHDWKENQLPLVTQQ
jgi:rhodanese-related sulfurtransferase